MFAEIAKSILEALKFAPRYLVAIAAITALLLFSPNNWLQVIGVDHFAQVNRQWFGLAFIISTIIWAVVLGADLLHWLKNTFEKKKRAQRTKERLRLLTEEEKQILRYYLMKGTRTNILKIDDGIVRGLVSAGIIYQSAKLGSIIDGFAHNITDNAWDFIQVNPEVLEGTTDTARTDKPKGQW